MRFEPIVTIAAGLSLSCGPAHRGDTPPPVPPTSTVAEAEEPAPAEPPLDHSPLAADGGVLTSGEGRIAKISFGPRDDLEDLDACEASPETLELLADGTALFACYELALAEVRGPIELSMWIHAPVREAPRLMIESELFPDRSANLSLSDPSPMCSAACQARHDMSTWQLYVSEPGARQNVERCDVVEGFDSCVLAALDGLELQRGCELSASLRPSGEGAPGEGTIGP